MKMGLHLEVDKCCVTVDLRIGSMAIGYTSLIGNCVIALILIICVGNATTTMYHASTDAIKLSGKAHVIVLSVLLAATTINLVFNIILLTGIHKHKPELIKAYLIYTVLYVMVCISAVFCDFLIGKIYFGYVFRDVICLVFSVYALLVIKSFFSRMAEYFKGPVMYTAP